MAKLIYASIASLDGYVADQDGDFSWGAPDEELHAFINDLERPIGTYLYGRRMYEVMKVWDDPAMADGEPAVIADYSEVWRSADKIVYSRTLEEVTTASTRIERELDAGAVRALKEGADLDLSIGGPEVAAAAFAAGLVDELHQFLAPVIVAGGTRSLPENVHLDLELLDSRQFGGGFVHLHHRVR